MVRQENLAILNRSKIKVRQAHRAVQEAQCGHSDVLIEVTVMELAIMINADQVSTHWIQGVTIVGEHAGDLLSEFVLAMKHRLGLHKILGTIPAHPTRAEANKYAMAE